MKRQVLFIPLTEILEHFAVNTRQDIKVVAPSLLTDQLFDLLSQKGREPKQEVPLPGDTWRHTSATQANQLCESSDFSFDLPDTIKGPFAISFANEKAEQEEHYHKCHTEIYFSEHRIQGHYRSLEQDKPDPFDLENGGLVLFQPYTVHCMQFSGLTLIIETPALDNDKFTII